MSSVSLLLKVCCFPLRQSTVLFKNSNFSCTNWQLRLHPSCQFSFLCCSALHFPSPRFPCRCSLQKQQIHHRFLRSVLACRSGHLYRGALWHDRRANHKHSVLRRDKASATFDRWCDWPWHSRYIHFPGDDMGLCEKLVHGNQFEKFFQHYGPRKEPSSILQVTLAWWAVLFSVIIVLLARTTHDANAVAVFLGPLQCLIFSMWYCSSPHSRLSQGAPSPFRVSSFSTPWHVTFIATYDLDCTETTRSTQRPSKELWRDLQRLQIHSTRWA